MPGSYASTLGGAENHDPNAHSQSQARSTHNTSVQNQGPGQSRLDVRSRSRSPFENNPAHIPKTSQDEASSYILTLQTTEELHISVNNLRQRYFPRKLNKIPAHLTLFHALPGSKLESIRKDPCEVAGSQTSFSLSTGNVKRLKRGVAIFANGTQSAEKLHGRLRDMWLDWLSEQDGGGFQGHWSVMNKVEDEEAVQRAEKEIAESFMGVKGEAQGLTLWKYEKGFWRFPEQYTFSRKDQEAWA